MCDGCQPRFISLPMNNISPFGNGRRKFLWVNLIPQDLRLPECGSLGNGWTLLRSLANVFIL